MAMIIRKTGTGTLGTDKYDWADLFMRLKSAPRGSPAENVAKILRLLKLLTSGAKNDRAGAHAGLNLILRRFQWRSVVSPTAQGIREILLAPMPLSDGEKWEYAAVRWLLDVHREQGGLDRVHLCPMHGEREKCEGWFYGRKNEKFCTGACKQYRYDSEDAVKDRRARRAKHNRDYRINLKREDARLKRAVGYCGKPRARNRDA
jgi:hypothetical protein